MPSTVIAIDGPAASGKTTAAKNLAKKMHIPYINTGSLYRAIAWKVNRLHIEPSDENAIRDMLATTELCYKENIPGANPDVAIDGVFPGQELRAPEIAGLSSRLSALPFVREFALDIQRKTAKTQLVILEGRDIGTVVFPDAQFKFYITASPMVRAQRRMAQGEVAPGATIESVAAEIAERDHRDATRAVAPLKQADDAILIDTSETTQEEVLDKLLHFIQAKQQEQSK